MIKINNKCISLNHKPYIIAELSANHNGSLERAKLLIKAAFDSGADAVKFQTYSADSMTINCDKDDFIIKQGPWDGYKLYELYGQATTPYEWHKELFSYANEIGIDCFSTPFDESAYELLEELKSPAYKIASFELTDLPLIKLVAKTGKPLLISTGMATEDEISDAIKIALDFGSGSILLFHCISSYPAPIEQSNLKKIISLRNKFPVEAGLSDHTLGTTAAIAAIALGATAIEKHFTLSRNEKGLDSEFSIEPKELRELVNESQNAWLSLGSGNFSIAESERSNLMFRRSLYFIRDLKAGHVITKNDIRRIRPGFGLPPKYYDDLIGKKVRTDVNFGDAVTFDKLI
jgi:pseudaminic acid synthase